MLSFEQWGRPKARDILKNPWVSGDIAPSTPLPHVLEGVRHLRLDELQKLVLRLMEMHATSGLSDVDRLFSELATDGVIRQATLSEHIKQEMAWAARQQKSELRLHDFDQCFNKLDLSGAGALDSEPEPAHLSRAQPTTSHSSSFSLAGAISLSEFRAAALALRHKTLLSLLKPVFDLLDSEKVRTVVDLSYASAVHTRSLSHTLCLPSDWPYHTAYDGPSIHRDRGHQSV